MNLRNLRQHFWEYLRGGLRGHVGVRIGRGVRLTGPGVYDLRRGATLADDVRVWVGPGATLTMMSGSKLGDRTILNVETGVTLCRDVRVSWDVQILDTDFHWIRDETGRVRPHTKPIVLEDRVLVGARSMILKGVVVSAGSVVGAGSVVRRSVPPESVVSGNPAEIVGSVSEWGSARAVIPKDDVAVDR